MTSKLEQFLSQVLSEERRDDLIDKYINHERHTHPLNRLDPVCCCYGGYSARNQDVKALIEMLREAIKQRDEYIVANWDHEDDCGNELAEIRLRNQGLEAIAERAMKECGE